MKKWFGIGIIITILLAVVLTVAVQMLINQNTSKYQISSEKQLAQKEEEQANQQQENIELITTSTAEESISPNAIIVFKTYYNGCDHTVTQTVDVPKDLINKGRQEVIKRYKDWDLGSFENTQIVLYKDADGICNEHYLIKENNGYVAVYYLDEQGNETLKETTSIVMNYLPETDIERLKQGIKVVGDEQLNATLEDYE
ncbi:MAG: BofC C-terminal domain-containing protein [Clostridia bacterium]